MRCNDIKLCHPLLQRKIPALLKEVNAHMPAGWELILFETYRSREQQLAYYKAGTSKLKFGKHCLMPCEAADFVFKHMGIITWNAPQVKLRGRVISGWDILDLSAEAHNLHRISWDKPHVELKLEEIKEWKMSCKS